MNEPLPARVRQIELLILDVDGVLTDGSITYSDRGEELKTFHVRDGSAIKFWMQAGKKVAILSGRQSAAVERRAAELGISLILQGAGEKWSAFQRILKETGCSPSAACMMGDDLPDLPVIRGCGLGITVADACAEVRAAAAFTTSRPGGRGAVREAIEWLLTGQGLWDQVVERFDSPGPVA